MTLRTPCKWRVWLGCCDTAEALSAPEERGEAPWQVPDPPSQENDDEKEEEGEEEGVTVLNPATVLKEESPEVQFVLIKQEVSPELGQSTVTTAFTMFTQCLQCLHSVYSVNTACGGDMAQEVRAVVTPWEC